MDYILNGLYQAFVLLLGGDEQTLACISVTLRVSTLSIVSCLVLGAPLGFLLGYYTFPGKKILRLIVDTLLSFPTVVIGLMVYAFISKNAPFGDFGLLFTIPGIAFGQTLLGLPIVVALTASAVEALDTRLRHTLLTLGASPRDVLLTTLWEARFSLMVAAAAAYGRIVSEIGISMMIGGNIKWHTRTITTAIAMETGKGEFAMGIALGMVLMVIALLVNVAVVGFRRLSAQ